MTNLDDRPGQERRLIFENYANGVDIEALKSVFKRSALEIEADILFVAKKIKEYRFRRITDASPHAAAPVACDTLIDIRLHRMALLDTLRKLGDLYLSSDLLLPKVTIQKLDHPSMIAEARHRMRG